MSNLKQKHKDYLIKNEIKDLTDLVNYVEILRNTSNLKGEDRQMLFDFAFLITNEQLSLKSFFAENKIDYTTTPSKEFYNAFKQTTSSPTFMDEVLSDLEEDVDLVMVQVPIGALIVPKEEQIFWAKKVLGDSKTETHTEVPNFNVIDVKQILPKHILNVVKEQDIVVEQDLIGNNNPPFRTVEETERQGEFTTMEEMVSAVHKKEKEGFNSSDHYLADEIGYFKQCGKKETKGKIFYELDFEFIKQMAERMQSNKDNSKYELWNWKKPLSEKDLEELKQAMWRHIIAVMSGGLEDDGRPFGHLEAISNNAMMINYQLKLKKC